MCKNPLAYLFLVPFLSFAHGRYSKYLKPSVVQPIWQVLASGSPDFALLSCWFIGYFLSVGRSSLRIKKKIAFACDMCLWFDLLWFWQCRNVLFLCGWIFVFCFMASGFRVIFRKGFPTLILLYFLKTHLCFLLVFLSFLFLFRFLIHLGFVLALGGERSNFLSSDSYHIITAPVTEWSLCAPLTHKDTLSHTLSFQLYSGPIPLPFPCPHLFRTA